MYVDYKPINVEKKLKSNTCQNHKEGNSFMQIYLKEKFSK